MKGFLRYLGSVLIGRLRKLIGLRSFPRCQFLLVLRASRIVFGLFIRSFFYRHLYEKWNYAQVTVIEIDSFIFQIVNKNSLFTILSMCRSRRFFYFKKDFPRISFCVCVCVSASVIENQYLILY